jgi:hypothetical protein
MVRIQSLDRVNLTSSITKFRITIPKPIWLLATTQGNTQNYLYLLNTYKVKYFQTP